MDPKVLDCLMMTTRMLEKTEDRSFMIAGRYPLTPGTIGPVSTRQTVTGPIVIDLYADRHLPVPHFHALPNSTWLTWLLL